jgi:hypothetical protein
VGHDQEALDDETENAHHDPNHEVLRSVSDPSRGEEQTSQAAALARSGDGCR